MLVAVDVVKDEDDVEMKERCQRNFVRVLECAVLCRVCDGGVSVLVGSCDVVEVEGEMEEDDGEAGRGS